jgi:hypothetical protein
VGPSTDGVQDKLDGGLNNDTCQGPPPDPDSLASCENQGLAPVTGPGSSRASATELCKVTGGTFADLGPLAYNCVFLNAFSNHRVPEARKICTNRSGTFVNAVLIYSCVLPN